MNNLPIVGQWLNFFSLNLFFSIQVALTNLDVMIINWRLGAVTSDRTNFSQKVFSPNARSQAFHASPMKRLKKENVRIATEMVDFAFVLVSIAARVTNHSLRTASMNQVLLRRIYLHLTNVLIALHTTEWLWKYQVNFDVHKLRHRISGKS